MWGCTGSSALEGLPFPSVFALISFELRRTPCFALLRRAGQITPPSQPALRSYFAWGCFRHFWWGAPKGESGLPSRSARIQARLRQGFGVAAFARIAVEGGKLACLAVAREASEGWWWMQSPANRSPCYLAGISVFSDKNSERAVQLVEKALQPRHFSQFALF